jgi:predicted DNA-binding transcriptional regulator AlpA
MRKARFQDGKRAFWPEHQVDHWIRCRIRGVDPAAIPPEEPDHPRLIPQREVLRRVGLSRVTIWRLEQKGSFPSRVRLDAAA